MSKSQMTPEEAAALPYRPCVGQMVINRQGLVWLGCRVDAKGNAEGSGSWWQMPQGGIDPDEDPEAAARRELIEETGIRSIALMAEHPEWVRYDLPDRLIGKAWGGKYRGQTQKWFAYRFLGDDSEVSIVPPPGHRPEFMAWRWAPVGDVLPLIVPFKREVYRAVLDVFSGLARPQAD